MKILLVLFITACATCTTSSGPSDVDPVGTWAMQLSPGTGNCGLTGSTFTREVIRDSTGLHWTGFPASGSASIDLFCDEQHCENDFTEVDSTGTARIVGALTLDAHRQIFGSGVVEFTGTAMCRQGWAATGALR